MTDFLVDLVRPVTKKYMYNRSHIISIPGPQLGQTVAVDSDWGNLKPQLKQPFTSYFV